MPTYQYGCKSCPAVFEDVFKVEERNKPCECPCPDCGGELYLRLFPCGFQFRGAFLRKPPTQFNERLKEIKKNHPHGSVNIIE